MIKVTWKFMGGAYTHAGTYRRGKVWFVFSGGLRIEGRPAKETRHIGMSIDVPIDTFHRYVPVDGPCRGMQMPMNLHCVLFPELLRWCADDVDSSWERSIQEVIEAVNLPK